MQGREREGCGCKSLVRYASQFYMRQNAVLVLGGNQAHTVMFLSYLHWILFFVQSVFIYLAVRMDIISTLFRESVLLIHEFGIYRNTS